MATVHALGNSSLNPSEVIQARAPTLLSQSSVGALFSQVHYGPFWKNVSHHLKKIKETPGYQVDTVFTEVWRVLAAKYECAMNKPHSSSESESSSTSRSTHEMYSSLLPQVVLARYSTAFYHE